MKSLQEINDLSKAQCIKYKSDHVYDFIKEISLKEYCLYDVSRSLDVNPYMVQERIDEINGIPRPLKEAYCSGMEHCFYNGPYDCRNAEVTKIIQKLERDYGVNSLNFIQRARLFDELEKYYKDLDDKIELIEKWPSLPNRTQEELEEYGNRLEAQFEEWAAIPLED